MSDHNHNSSDNLLAGLVGKALYILVPVILIVMMGIVGAAFIGGGGHQPVADLKPPVRPGPKFKLPKEGQMEMGKAGYVMCSACHGANGEGGPANMAPPLVQSKILLGHPEASLAAVHKGIIKGPDSKYLGVMVGLPLGDEKVAAILTYVRNSFGNRADAIYTEESAAIRKKYADSASLPREKIEELSAQ